MDDKLIITLRKCEYFKGAGAFLGCLIAGYAMNRAGGQDLSFLLLFMGFCFVLVGAGGLLWVCSFSRLEFYENKIIAHFLFGKIESKYTQIDYFYIPYRFIFNSRVLVLKINKHLLPLPFFGIEQYLVRNDELDSALELLRQKGVKENWAFFF